MIFTRKITGRSYFLYTQDTANRVAFHDDVVEGRIGIFALKDGELCFDCFLEEDTDEYQQYYNEHNVHDVDASFVKVFEITKNGHLVFEEEMDRQYIHCLYLKIANDRLCYSVQPVELMTGQKYPSSHLLWCKRFNDTFLTREWDMNSYGKNTWIMRTIIKDLVAEFPYLHLPESVFKIQENDLHKGPGSAVFFKTVSLEEILVHKYYYDTDVRYRDMVNAGFGHVAFDCLVHSNANILQLNTDEGSTFDRFYKKTKGHRYEELRKESRETMWNRRCGPTVRTLLMLDGLSSTDMGLYIEMVGHRDEDYQDFEELREYMPPETTVGDAVRMVAKALMANSFSSYLVSDLLRFVKDVALTKSLEEIHEMFKKLFFREWEKAAQESKDEFQRRAKEKIRKTFLIDDYRKACRLNSDIDARLRLKFIWSADALDDVQMEFFMKKMPELKKDYVLYHVSGIGPVVRNAFLVLGLKDGDMEMMDMLSEEDEKMRGRDVDRCWDFLNKYHQKFHNLYLANHELV